jgi:hypothetical protein
MEKTDVFQRPLPRKRETRPGRATWLSDSVITEIGLQLRDSAGLVIGDHATGFAITTRVIRDKRVPWSNSMQLPGSISPVRYLVKSNLDFKGRPLSPTLFATVRGKGSHAPRCAVSTPLSGGRAGERRR